VQALEITKPENIKVILRISSSSDAEEEMTSDDKIKLTLLPAVACCQRTGKARKESAAPAA
jgi:hypothetical protein